MDRSPNRVPMPSFYASAGITTACTRSNSGTSWRHSMGWQRQWAWRQKKKSQKLWLPIRPHPPLGQGGAGAMRMKTELLPFTNEMIPEAGKLLARRHACNREQLPLLPERFEETGIATRAVETLWQEKYKGGYAAFRDGRMIAYLIGQTSTNPWGRAGTVYLPGYAVAEEEKPAVIQDLYALLGDLWVKKGCFDHYLYISAADA